MSKHTPGPWFHHDVFGDRILTADSPKGQLNIGAVFNSCEYQASLPLMANAALMSAAPELLDTLKKALSWLDRDPRRYAEWGSLARSAIAKATALERKFDGAHWVIRNPATGVWEVES